VKKVPQRVTRHLAIYLFKPKKNAYPIFSQNSGGGGRILWYIPQKKKMTKIGAAMSGTWGEFERTKKTSPHPHLPDIAERRRVDNFGK
jgi:hypothetical protein